MARSGDVIGKCQRCYGGKVPAVARVRFNYKGTPYETILCASHAEKIELDMQAWVRTATELGVTREDSRAASSFARPIGAPYVAEEAGRAPVRVPRIVQANTARPGLPVPDPALALRMGYDPDPAFPRRDEIRPETVEAWQDAFTEHALERMELRQISVTQVLRCIQSPAKTRRCPSKPGADTDTAMYVFEDVKVIVNERTRSILTVSRPSDDVFQSTEAV